MRINLSNTFNSAYNHKVLDEVLDNLVKNQFLLENSLNNDMNKIEERKIIHAAWLASILSQSENEKHKQKALSFATLAYLQNKDKFDFEKFCYIIQSRTGTIPASSHLENIFDSNTNKFRCRFGL